MSITPVMESSSIDFRKNNTVNFKQRQMVRQNSYGTSDIDNQSRSENSQNIKKESEDQAQKSVKQKILTFISLMAKNLYFQLFITLLTVVTLFLYDVKTIAISKEYDYQIGISNCVFFVIFMIEIFMNIQTKGYFLSFFFFLDLVATITILLDVEFITDILFDQSSSNFQVSGFIAKSKASRAAARAVRIVKIFRLTRIAKLYKAAQKTRQLNNKNKMQIIMKQADRMMANAKISSLQSNGLNDGQNINSKNEDTIKNEEILMPIKTIYPVQNDQIKQDDNSRKTKKAISQNNLDKNQQKNILSQEKITLQQLQNKQSKISRILSQDNIKKIVIIILIIMISIPIVDINNYISISNHWDYMTQFIVTLLSNNIIPLSSINQLIQSNINTFKNTDPITSVICIQSPFAQLTTCDQSVSLQGLRVNDLGVFFQTIDVNLTMNLRPYLTLSSTLLNQQSSNSLVIYINYQKYNQIDAGFSIITTIFICLTIIYLLDAFSSNINDLIINPIQKMLNLVNSNDFRDQNDNEDEIQNKQFQTKLVEKAIIRIKMLMETIFNPLGHNMIQAVFMKNNQSISTNLKHSIKKSLIIFSLCKVKNLHKICSVLEEDTFGFMNEISIIVHNSAYIYGGFCTKIQDGEFLITFQIPENQIINQKIDIEMSPKDIYTNSLNPENSYSSILSDFAIYSAVQTCSQICKDIKISKYRNDQRLLMAFDGAFNVQINFGLNLGWAQQMITGSVHKLDHQYIGQTINRLHDMLKLSKQSTYSILISESIYLNLNKGTRQYCRGFDCIKFAQNNYGEIIYVVDLQISNVNSNRRQQGKSKDNLDNKILKQMNMVYLSQNSLSKQNYNPKAFVTSKKQLRQILKSNFNQQVKKQYRLAFQKYLKGHWLQCIDLLQNQKLKNDLVSKRIYQFAKKVHKNGNIWKGYRQFNTL